MAHELYFDYAAATPLDPEALKAMESYLTDSFYNPSALYIAARQTKKELEAFRAEIAVKLGARPAEIVFTAGGTEANNLAIRGIMEKYPGKRCLISGIEHESVRMPAELYGAEEVAVDKYGRLELADLRAKLTDEVVLVSVIYASNEVGTVQRLADIASTLEEVRRDRRKRGVELPLFFHTDACQAASYLPLSASRLGVDMMTLNGGKIHGPKQSGLLFISSGVQLAPQVLGGGQERSLRSGTENVAAIAGFAAALRKARELKDTETMRVGELTTKLRRELEAFDKRIVFHGHPKRRLPNHLAFSLPGSDNERLVMELDERGFIVANGSACSAAKGEPSRALRNMGVDDDTAYASLRITLGRGTADTAVTELIAALQSVLKV